MASRVAESSPGEDDADASNQRLQHGSGSDGEAAPASVGNGSVARIRAGRHVRNPYVWEQQLRKKLTITVDEEVYEGLHRVVGRRHISRFLTELARPHVVQDDLEAGYRAMAADEDHEREAMEWFEGVIADVADEPG